MSETDVETRLARVEERGKSNTHRINEIIQRQDNFDKLVSSVEVLATRQEHVETDVKEIKSDVKALTEKPGKRWENLVWECVKLLVAAVIGFALAQIGV